MTLLVAWIAFPLVLAALSLGCGLAVERLAGVRLGALVLPVGFAAVVVLASFLVLGAPTARFAAPAVVLLAGAGFASSGRWWRRRPDVRAAAAAVATFAVFGLPVLASGEATFAGYIKLDDTATFLAMTDRVMLHGHGAAGLAPSTYEATLAILFTGGYPAGSLLPLGVGHALLGTDSAWLWQPYLSFLAALLALVLYDLGRRIVPRPWARALAAFVAAQAALLYGYALWGGVKELAAAPLLALAAALAPAASRRGARGLLPLALAAAALVAVLSAAGAVWLVAPLAAALVAGVRRRGARRTLRLAAAFAVLGLALAAPVLVAAVAFLPGAASFATASDRGNLIRPLNPLQALGIWPAGDFRLAPDEPAAAYALAALAALAAAGGAVWAWGRRAAGPLAYLASGLLGCLVFVGAGSPWIGAKALATASPVFLLLAAGAVGWLWTRERPVVAALLAAVLAGGVGWSNALAYHDVNLAPRGQLAELQAVGERFAGEGPALEVDYEPYGARHFLRRLDAEGASELRRRPVRLRSGGLLPKGESTDVDRIALPDLLVYRTLVLRRGPGASRPPSAYRLVWQGRWYDVWQRPDAPPPAILAHLSLGEGAQAAAVPRCADVLGLARRAGAGGELAAVERPANVVVGLGRAARSASWAAGAQAPGAIWADGAGEALAAATVPAGSYEVWLGGSFRGRVWLWVDGRPAGSRSDQLDWPGLYEPFGTVRLGAGRHLIGIREETAPFAPGDGGPAQPLGPVVLAASDPAASRVLDVPVSRARSLCGRRLDWVEALGP